MLSFKQRIQLFFGIKKLGCKWCLKLWNLDVFFRSEKAFYKHLKEVHGIIRVPKGTTYEKFENIND